MMILMAVRINHDQLELKVIHVQARRTIILTGRSERARAMSKELQALPNRET